MPDSLEVSKSFPVSAKKLYTAWLSSKDHSAFTGSSADVDPKVNGLFSAWDGYITGKTLELTPYTRILQSWRTTDFTDSDEDSLLEVLFREENNRTEITLKHTNLPPDTASDYKKGWMEYYFKPMSEFFTK